MVPFFLRQCKLFRENAEHSRDASLQSDAVFTVNIEYCENTALSRSIYCFKENIIKFLLVFYKPEREKI